jgi:hypothetical protein
LPGPSSSYASHVPSYFFHPSYPLTLLHNVLYPFASSEHRNPLLVDPLENRGYTIEKETCMQLAVR